MRKSYRYLAFLLMAGMFSVAANAQTVTISGNVRNSLSKDVIPAVSVTLKGTNSGTFTDERGNFKLVTSQKLPFTLVISSIGFETKEVTVTSEYGLVQVEITSSSSLGTEVVVSASRVPERILESPVSIERLGTSAIRNAAVPNFYEGLANLKGVDLTTSSLNFRTISTRGFNGSGNLRFNQLIDGMDNQAPGLNFSVGNIIGMTELDVENVELLQGASSALYGSGGANGTMLMTSKNPFKYQGLSFQVKQGIMHTDGSQRSPAPYYDWALRWGNKVTERFAFKISAEFMSAKDWQANDTRDLARNNVYSSIKPGGNRQNDPNYDGVNVFGDEVSASMQNIAQAAIFGPSNPTLTTVVTQLATSLGRMPTQQEIVGAYASNPAFGVLNIYGRGIAQNLYGSQLVSRTGYNESDLVDYNTYNFKGTGGLYYKLTNNVEASLVGYWGMGTTVYTGADRYALKNLKMGQYKAEIKGKNWFLRAYTTQENSGDSYTATTAAVAINRAWSSDANWLGTYSAVYAQARIQGADDPTAHSIARSTSDAGRLVPGSKGFQQAFNNAISVPISQGGAKFADQTSMYHYEGQLNLTEQIKVVEVLVGASYRKFKLNSHGTIFADTTGSIGISEYGAYIQLQKKLFNEGLKLTASGRYDKNENFDGRFTPRVTALIRVAKDNNIRLSYQSAYRFPSTQDQWINLNTPGSRLIGGLPTFNTYFGFDQAPAYTAESIVAYRNGGFNPALLQQASFTGLKPESVNSYELGYRGLLSKRFLLDAYVYYSQYKDFIARVAVGRGQSASTNPLVSLTELASPFTTTNYSFVTNTSQTVNAIGWGVSGEYQMSKGYVFTANISSDQLNNVPSGVVTFFNTPNIRYNIGLGNSRVAGGNWGFNLAYRWQNQLYWEGTFGTGEIPAFGTLDGQISYRLPEIRSMIKLGASNLTNKYYLSAFGNPQVGGVYYISFGYNVF
jgi:outer membrane receptor protein involved in Fe transport